MEENTDYFCVKCLADGDQSAFTALYNKYHRKIYYSALKMTRSEALAQDVVQDVFLKIWATRATLNPEHNFAAYISTICRNTIFDLFKKAAHEEVALKEWRLFAEILESDTEDDVYEEYKKRLDNAVAALPPQRRLVFEACKLQKKSYDEVAQKMNISRSTVQDHIVKANKSIREYLFPNPPF